MEKEHKMETGEGGLYNVQISVIAKVCKISFHLEVL